MRRHRDTLAERVAGVIECDLLGLEVALRQRRGDRTRCRAVVEDGRERGEIHLYDTLLDERIRGQRRTLAVGRGGRVGQLDPAVGVVVRRRQSRAVESLATQHQQLIHRRVRRLRRESVLEGLRTSHSVLRRSGHTELDGVDHLVAPALVEREIARRSNGGDLQHEQDTVQARRRRESESLLTARQVLDRQTVLGVHRRRDGLLGRLRRIRVEEVSAHTHGNKILGTHCLM